MRAAVISQLGQPPSLGDVLEPEGGRLIDVVAVALNPLDVAVGAGRFYGGHPPLPYVPGCEAVGRERDRGRLVWIYGGGLGIGRSGALAEVADVGAAAVCPVPDGADPAVAAALGIAGAAGWVPLAWRVPVRAEDTVLVLGATGTVGLVAVQAARVLGAARVVAAGRDPARLERAVARGADAAVELEPLGSFADRVREACGGDGPTLVFDPLWGEPAAAAAEAAPRRARIVHLGQSAGTTAPITSAALRGKELEIYGYSNFSVPPDVLAEQYAALVRHAIAGAITVDLERAPLEEVGDAWRRQAEGGRKVVVTI